MPHRGTNLINSAIDRMALRWQLRTQRSLEPAGPPIPGRRLAVTVLLTSTILTGWSAYALFERSTAIPEEPPYSGSIALLSSDAQAELSLNVHFFEKFSDYVDFGAPLERRNGMNLAITANLPAGDERAVPWMLIVQPGTLISEVESSGIDLDNTVHSHSATGNVHDADSGYTRCECQIVTGTLTVQPGAGTTVTIDVRLSAKLANTAGGLTYSRPPQFQPQEWEKPPYYFDHSLNVPGRWFPPSKFAVTVNMGAIVAGDSLSFVYPDADLSPGELPPFGKFGDEPELKWTAPSLPYARAEISNRAEQRRASGILFLAGGAAGLSSALLVETLLRLRSFRALEENNRLRKRRHKPTPMPRRRIRGQAVKPRRTTWF